MNFTKEQQLAISEKNKDILVSAAAGSGKTAILVERIIQMLLDESNPATVDTILVATFTKAATAEMKNRINNAFTKEVNKNPKNDYLRNQLSMINKASISTLDSFFNSVVKKYYRNIDIDPNYRIGDKAELDLLSKQVLDKYLEELYEKGDEAFIDLVDAYSSKANDNFLEALIPAILDKIENIPYREKWFKACLKSFDINTIEQYYKSDAFAMIKEEIKSIIKEAEEYIEESKKIYNRFLIQIPNYLSEDIIILNDIKKFIEKDLNEDLNDYLKKIKFLTATVVKALEPIKEDVELFDNAAASLKNLRNEFKNIVSNIKNYFEKSSEEYVEEYKYLYKITKKLIEIVLSFDDRLMILKKEKSLFSFSDITNFCYKILINEDGSLTSVALDYQKKFNEIIVDEFQDSNFLQDSILTAISRKSQGQPNMFMVGDLKQSIYKFRGAEPTMFKNKYKAFANTNDNSALKIDLNKNFRSRECVINCINFIFKQIMSENVGDVEYDKDNMLYCGADYPEPTDKEINYSDSCEFYVIDNQVIEGMEQGSSFSNSMEEINSFANAELEAAFIANRINQLINVEKLNIYDKNIGKYRPAEYRDFVILMRNVKLAEAFISIFNQNGIPALCAKGNGFYETLEIKIILSLLAIIDNPFLDIEMIAVLHSPIYSLTADELTEIRCFNKEGYFYSAMLDYAENNNANAELKNKILKIINDLEKWSFISKNKTISELLYILYKETDYYTYVGLLKNGEIRQANLDTLCEKADGFEQAGFNGLFRFITYVENIKTSSTDSQANVLAQAENIVQIMTIHSSKGLEFPIVFVAMLGAKFHNIESYNGFYLDTKYGIAPMIKKIVKPDELKADDKEFFEKVSPKISFSSQYANLVKSRLSKDNISEEMRILYVALTRAKEKLILVGSLDMSKKNEALLKNISFDKTTIAPSTLNGSLLKMVVRALARHPNNNFSGISYENPCSFNNIFENDKSKFIIKVIGRDDINFSKTEDDKKLFECFNALKEFENTEIDKTKELYKNLSFEYPFVEDMITPSTASISEIKKKRLIELGGFEEEKQVIEDNKEKEAYDEDFPLPEFYTEKKEINFGAFKGTATHTVMEHIDFNIKKVDELIALMNKLKEENILTQEEFIAVDKNKIMQFLSSDLCDRIKKSKNVFREMPFAMGMPANEVFKDKSTDTTVILHGIIDLYFEENDKIILVDYKTDNTTSEEEIKKRYQIQLDLYKEVLEKNTGKEVSEKIIYLFKTNKSILL